jgi:AcrR family transcriptional regulator
MVTSVGAAVKRPYVSTLRADQARATRRAIVDAAGRLFVAHGYGATTVDAIAADAGVSRKTVFTSVGGKVEALKLAVDWASVGDDEPVPMLERQHVRAAVEEPDARRILRLYAADSVRISGRAAALHAVVQAASGLDRDVRALAEDLRAQRLRGMTFIVELLAARSALLPGLTVAEAADVLWLLGDPAVYTRLVVEQGWPLDRFEEWLRAALVSLLVAPGYRPSRHAPRETTGRGG